MARFVTETLFLQAPLTSAARNPDERSIRSAICAVLPARELRVCQPISCLLTSLIGMLIAVSLENVGSGPHRGEGPPKITHSDSDLGAPRHSGPERRSPASAVEVTPVRLTHKYAQVINGVDLSQRKVGDRLPLPARDARMLIAEGWAESVAEQEQRGRDGDR